VDADDIGKATHFAGVGFGIDETGVSQSRLEFTMIGASCFENGSLRLSLDQKRR
jgi:hypothetical protein